MNIKIPDRPNFSKSGKICDQNLYFTSQEEYEKPNINNQTVQRNNRKQNQNFFFKSVSRQKRGNFRFDIKQTKGQFNYYPNYDHIKNKSPSWIIPKQEKYSNQKYEQLEFCQKHPLINKDQQVQMKSTSSMKQLIKEKVRMKKSSSMISTQVDFSMNYSIISPRQTSPSGFFYQSKIKNPRYLQKKDLCKLQSAQDHKNYINRLYNTQRGFIDYNRQKERQQNLVRKSFQYFRKNHNNESQFENFKMTQHPTKPQHHINFNLHLQRPSIYEQNRLGPNPQIINIDFCRPKRNNINYNLLTFRQKVRTRYDRVQPEPNTRLDSFIQRQKSKGMVEMGRVLSRKKELFPIIDPIIKKGGDGQMKEQLKKCLFKYEVNQAIKLVNPNNQIKLIA